MKLRPVYLFKSGLLAVAAVASVLNIFFGMLKKSHGFHEIEEIQGKVTIVLKSHIVLSRVARIVAAVGTGFNGRNRVLRDCIGCRLAKTKI